MANSLMNFVPDLHLESAELRYCLIGNIIIKENAIGKRSGGNQTTEETFLHTLYSVFLLPCLFLFYSFWPLQCPHENG